MPPLPATELILPLHLIAITCAAIGIFYADSLALPWITGKQHTIHVDKLSRAHLIVSIALTCIVTTGFLMFWPLREYLLHRPAFYIKMAFVATLIANAFAIGDIMHVASHKSFLHLNKKEKLPLIVSGALSVICWLGAGSTAFFFLKTKNS